MLCLCASMSWIFHVYHIFFTYMVSVNSAILTEYNRGRDSIILKPIELIDLILAERLRKEVLISKQHPKDGVKAIDRLLGAVAEKGERETEKVTLIRRWPRKVWSKWSKWSECSASCDEGARERRRQCVAGRCAHGEVELQRRPCNLAPCDISDTTHDDSDQRETK